MRSADHGTMAMLIAGPLPIGQRWIARETRFACAVCASALRARNFSGSAAQPTLRR